MLLLLRQLQLLLLLQFQACAFTFSDSSPWGGPGNRAAGRDKFNLMIRNYCTLIATATATATATSTTAATTAAALNGKSPGKYLENFIYTLNNFYTTPAGQGGEVRERERETGRDSCGTGQSRLAALGSRPPRASHSSVRHSVKVICSLPKCCCCCCSCNCCCCCCRLLPVGPSAELGPLL